MKPCFLDTCAVIDLMAGRQAARDALANFDHLLIGYVVLGELLLGCKRSPDPETEFSNLRKLLLNNTWIGADIPTSVAYARLGADLETSGQRIPQNDLWIAALCVRCNLPLISSDPHFSPLPELQWVEY
jgi:tRNA(fMet)-specific endonuclease VapC